MKNILTLWEEKDSIEHSKKFENKPTFVPNDGINETNNVFVKNECNDTGNGEKRKRKRKCFRTIEELRKQSNINTKRWYQRNKQSVCEKRKQRYWEQEKDNEKRWVKECPKCKRKQFYATRNYM